jgi:acetolactate synthase-1/2/3 large subunit
MTQLNYFGGEYLGCDVESGLGFPDWEQLFGAYGIPVVTVDAGNIDSGVLETALERPGPSAVIVKIDAEQTYFPKISSRVTEDGSMVSSPLHRMSPDLPDDLFERVGRYLPDE